MSESAQQEVSPTISGLPVKLIVGLGNPGSHYDHTRHNVGFALLDRFAQKYHARWEHLTRWNAQVAKVSLGEDPAVSCYLFKPMTFMNLSGTSVAPYVRFFQWKPSQVLVISDDVSLPLTTLRLRPQGSSGGQKGLKSILVHLGTEKVPRLRLGVGPFLKNSDLGGDKSYQFRVRSLPDYVLAKFSCEEERFLDETLLRAMETLESILQDGLVKAMNFYHQVPSQVPVSD